RAARPRARRLAAAVPAPRRGDARHQRRAAALDPLPRPSGAVRRHRAQPPGLLAAHRSHQRRRLRPALARDRERRPHRQRPPVLRAEGRHPGVLVADARRRRRAGARGARGRGASLGAGRGDHRGARRRRCPDRRRRPGRARADGAPPDGRCLPGAGATAPQDRAALRRGADAPGRRRRRSRDRRRRGAPLRRARRADRRGGPDLGHRGVSPAVPRAAVAVADLTARAAGRRGDVQRQEEGLERAGRVGPALSTRDLSERDYAERGRAGRWSSAASCSELGASGRAFAEMPMPRRSTSSLPSQPVTTASAAPQNERTNANVGGCCTSPERSHRLIAKRARTTTLPPPWRPPIRFARVPDGIATQSMRPNGAASRPPTIPEAISAYATVAAYAAPDARWMMSKTTDVASSPSGKTTSIWWTGCPNSLTLLSMSTSGVIQCHGGQTKCPDEPKFSTAQESK